MFRFKDVIGVPVDVVVAGLAVLIFFLLIISIVILVRQSKLKKRYAAFMKGENGKSLEEAFAKKFENIDIINDNLKEIFVRLEMIDKNLLGTYQKIGIVKYDAFKEVGGTLSFAMALLTKENDGFLLNSMHSNRDGCFIYVKEVKKGEVFITLSDEEAEALEQAKNQEF